MTEQQREATINFVRPDAEGDPASGVYMMRVHLAIVLAALDEARRERDAARRDLAAERGRVVAWLRGQHWPDPRTSADDVVQFLASAIEAGEHEGGEHG